MTDDHVVAHAVPGMNLTDTVSVIAGDSPAALVGDMTDEVAVRNSYMRS